jgi:hypothetical protein
MQIQGLRGGRASGTSAETPKQAEVQPVLHKEVV